MGKSAILCVDDEPMVLTSLKEQMYNRFGSRFMYEFAESADEADEVIEELAADGVHLLIIVSDWLMPGVKGDEFLVRVHKRFPGIVKVMLTGQADEGAIRRAQEDANLFRCIHKPWTEEELAETILSGLEQCNE